MDWSSIIGQRASPGAATATMDSAFDGLRQPAQRSRPLQFVPNPLLQQQQAVLALLAQHKRAVNVATLDLVGVWINAEGFWMQVTRGLTGFIYVGRDILNNVCENGILRPAGNSVVCSGHNSTIGAFSAEFNVVNEDLLACTSSGSPQILILRRLSSAAPKSYLLTKPRC